MSDNNNSSNNQVSHVTFTGAHLLFGGLSIHERRWTNDDEKVSDERKYKALAYLCHGFAEHCGYFHQLAERLAADNFLVVGLDYYGHGLSDGNVNQMKSFDTFVEHARAHVSLLRAEYPDLAVHGIGYSMGALILHRLSISGGPQLLSDMIWISPALQPAGMKLTKRKVELSKRIMRYLPNLPLPGGKFSPADLTRNKETQNQMSQDASIKQRTLYSRFAALMLEAMYQTEPEAICLPTLVVTGTADKIADTSRTANFVSAAQLLGKPLTSRVYPGAYHQLHTDLPAVGTDLHRDLLHWLQVQQNVA